MEQLIPRARAAVLALACAGALAAAAAAWSAGGGAGGGGTAGRDVLEGRVVSVVDGDTLELRTADATIRVRIAGIDTPERGQPWATRAKQALAQRVFGKPVRIIAVDVDRYGRTVGEVYADDVCVGCELVREGHAWVYRRFSDDPVLLELEAQAREAQRGLWSLPESERVPPWEWRRRRAHAGAGRPGAEPPAAPLECGARRSCRELSSCAQARFQLEECGRSELDGDGDGVPCEALCGGGP